MKFLNPAINNTMKFLAFIAAVTLLSPLSAGAKGLEIGSYSIEYDEAVEADTNGNGTNDRVSYYQNGVLQWAAYDEDEDGEPDLWFRYKGGDVVDLELRDRDGDGEPDRIAEIDYQEKADVVYDSEIAKELPSEGSFSPWLIGALILAALFFGRKFIKKILIRK